MRNRLDYLVQVEALRASPDLRARINALAGTVRPQRKFRPWMGLCDCLAVVLLGRYKVVGRITGPEWDHLEMGGVTYARRDSTPYSIADKGEFLGLATDGERKFRLYAVKGDEERNYIYCFWDWEGFFYQKE